MSEKKKPSKPDLDYSHPLLDFPSGSGDANCPTCGGRGVVPVMVDVGGGVMWPGGGTQNCKCVFKRDLIANVKRVWKVLMSVESAESSPLIKLTKQNVWLTASGYDLRQHLRFVAFRMGPSWDARVVGDATLMTAWLSTKKDVFDADVLLEREGRRDRPSEHYLTMVDLAVPFDLLIIVLGVKAAANKEMANLLVEAINERDLVGKPTWIVDSPIKPLAPGHLCFNDSVMEILDSFRRVNLSDTAPRTRAPTTAGQYKAHAASPATVEPSTTMSAGRYGRKPGMATTRMPGAPVPPSFDKDENPNMMSMERDGSETDDEVVAPSDDPLDLDALLANPHDPNFMPDHPGILPGDGDIDVEELLENFPDASELGGNAKQLPGFLTGSTTKSEQMVQETQARYARRGHRNRQSDGGDDA